MKDRRLNQNLGWRGWQARLKATLQPLRTRLLNDPFYRFQSIEEVAIAAELGIAIDVNQATVDDWLRLPGISIHQARSLVGLTQAGVQFHALDDIAAVLNVSEQRLQPLAPILRFCYYDPAQPLTPQRLNPNQASVEQLFRVPGIDLYLARSIVKERQQAGSYRSIADLQQRLALSADLTAQLMHWLCF